MGNKYIGLTVGPIFKTLQNAKKTGQLWGSSYIFSYIMKNIIKEIKSRGITKEFVLPYVDDEIFHIQNGVGLFPDRIIFKSSQNAFEEMSKIRDEVIIKLGEEIAEVIEENKNKVIKYLDEYFSIYFLEKEIENSSPILELTPYLDMLELQQKIINEDKGNYLTEFFKNQNVKSSFLAEDGFGKKIKGFDSIPDIAIRDIQELDEIKNEMDTAIVNDEKYFEKIYVKLAENNLLKKHHKYLAIVQTDGDNISKVIESIGDNEEKLRSFSKRLFYYAIDAVKIIQDKGGYPIYAGGDDLLFFAPVVNGYETIFDLIELINKQFNYFFKQERKSLKLVPSLSFGVSITYYKYPLYEALEQVSNLLFSKAKKFKMNGRKKDAIALQVVKHSGQVFGYVVRNNSNSYSQFKKLIKCYQMKGDILHSILFKLYQDKELLENAINKDENMIDNYFVNNFDEDIHKEAGKKEFILSVNQLIKETYKETSNIESINQVYSYLKFLKFLNEEN